MGKLVRAISADGSVMAAAIDSTDIVAEIERIHQTSAVITAGLGRLATAASIMGYMLKGEKDSLTLRINGGGPSGSLIAVSNCSGNVKAFVENAVVELPLNQYGKLDVKGAVGNDGFLSVVKDLGLKEPYVGQTPIVSGEIAEDITNYYAVSEQTPTVCGLGVLVNPDLSVRAAGGYLVQLLPFADEACIDTIEENIRNIQSVSSMIDNGMTPEDIINLLLKNLEPNVLDETTTAYKCDCSKQRVEKALISIGKEELTNIREEQGECEVSCHFCNRKYLFSREDLNNLIENQ
ncbi:Hsp33 family molecular chaperone HslO [Paludicola sp. MB14-C6]|uniref:Hsp33 family molecular chaperone HslO n=1 Tax=Paludihabitans sp. MB14-C6 TaxID=3070656 RepID=UPI0027DE0419|nr:Hsp33 family molecular chaperone HslO [Paludicola sp. MB14-C6]WMJ22830.1 Hsp33 family molecular chaperone HslO [Paludicola sp. MB14-C6]